MAATEKRPEIIELAKGLAGVPFCEDYERMVSGMMYVSFIIYLQLYELVVNCLGTTLTSRNSWRRGICAGDVPLTSTIWTQRL